LMKILVDMNLTPRWVGHLRQCGHDALHWSSAGRISAPDQEICDYARLHGYVLLTNDLDFPRILAHTRENKPSVVLLRGEPLIPETRGGVVALCLQECEVELTRGAIVTLDWSDQFRARVLPLS
jgi:predicted nuclease of predicted toxin-antitoxin system